MILIAQVVAVLFVGVFAQSPEKQSTVSALERLQARISVDRVGSRESSALAGYYKHPSSELIKHIGGVLDGDELYLFPDGTYIYCEWGDISPLTIYDKGAWLFENGFIELKSDPDVTWDTDLGPDRTYIAVRRRARAKEVLLIGVSRDLLNFERGARDDPEMMLLMVCKKRETLLSRATSKSIKAKLLRESWHPPVFEHDRPSK